MKSAFVNAAGILTGLGYAESNDDDRKVAVPDDVDMHPGEWRLVGDQWELTHPELSEGERRMAAMKLLAAAAAESE